jgi:subtilisin-like proprotein convertase family protein
MGTALPSAGGALLLAFALLASGLAAPASAQIPTLESQTATPNAVITDDGYIGSLDGNDGTGADAGMTCAALDFSGSAITTVTGVTMDLGLSHSWIGDLVVKLMSPSGTLLAPLNRPGYTGPDDGTGGVGDSANLSSGDLVTFDDDSTKTAESMGDESTLSAYVVCQNAPFNCGYTPSPDGVANSVASFAGFSGEDPDGVWAVCVGDAAPLDQGTFGSVTLNITGERLPSIGFSATVNSTNFPSNGGTVVFMVTVTNNEAVPVPAELWLVATGPLNRTLLLRQGTMPANTTLNGRIGLYVSQNAPDGVYNVDLHVGDFDTNTVYATQSFVITKGNPRAQVAERTKAQAELDDRPVSPQAAAPGAPFVVGRATGALFAPAPAPAPSAVVASPNPFQGRTTLSFEVAEAADVRLAVYDVLGREVAVLADGPMAVGRHEAAFDAEALPAGAYVYRLTVGRVVQTGRLTVAR